MNHQIGRNAPCPCGSGKKYKNCCMGKSQPEKSPQSLSPGFRFEPGSYGGVGAFVPSIACLQQTQPDEWEYYFVLVKPHQIYDRETEAVVEAEGDLQAAFSQREKTGSDFTVAENLRAKGYLKVDGFKIVTDETNGNDSDDGTGFRL
jgi:hypothetical protein